MTELPTEPQPVSLDAKPPSLLLRLYPSLAVPPFRLLWLGMLPASLAWQVTVVVTGYAALTLSDSATAIGLVMTAMGLPMMLLALVGGVVADRFPRRTVLLLTQSTLGLGVGTLAALSLAGLLQVWHLIALGFIQGVAFSFNMPSRQAYMAELVGARLLRNAVAVNNAGMNFCRIAGPALGGVLLALPAVGIGGTFTVVAGMYVTVVATLLRLPATSAAAGKAGRKDGGWDALVEGLRYIRHSPALVALLGLAIVTVCLGLPYQQLMPLFSEHVFNVGAAGLGMLMAASGVGALAGAVAVAALSSVSRQGTLQLGLGVGFGLTLAGFALAPWLPLAVGLVVLVGFASAAYTSLNNTLIMANTEPRLFGRVMSVYMLTFAVQPVGALPLAWLADQVGARAAIAGGGVVVALTVAAVALLYPAYRHIR